MSLPSIGRLSSEFWEALHGIKSVQVYPKGEVLFDKDAPLKGLFIVESGRVRILLPTTERRPQLLEIAGPGSILALSESMSGDNYRTTAEVEQHATVAFIERQRFLEFLREHCEFCMQVVRLLSEDLHALYHKFRSISAHPGRPRHRMPDQQLN